MKYFTLFIMLTSSAFAMKPFIEPGVFVNMSDSAAIKYDGNNGYLRNNDFSYAVKFGFHHGHYEYGIESEIYDFVAHIESETGNYSLPLQITYNSLFFGYEFLEEQFLYISISNHPYASIDGKSFKERHSVLSLEYSNHIKEWVSLNVKIETNSVMKVDNNPDEKLHFGNLVMLGFSFPLMSD